MDKMRPTAQEIKDHISCKKKEFRGELPRNGLSIELTAKFCDLSNRLSPENLNEDGEITAAQAQRKFIQIKKEWKALEQLAGRKVSESEFPY